MTAVAFDNRAVSVPTDEAFDWRRAAYALAALIAWAGLALSLFLALTDPTYWPNAAERFTYWGSYFTILSNIAVAVVTTMLALDPRRTGTWFNAMRMASLVMITVTAAVYSTVLAPAYAELGLTPTGLDAVSDNLLHVITPVLAVAVFLLVDYRGRMKPDTLLRCLALPMAWLGYTLVRGALIDWYPYPFLDVTKLGYQATIVNIIAIVAVGLLIGALYLAYDKLSPVGREKS